jgi:broad specificity phosphatase PhoE
VRAWNGRIEAEHGSDAVWAAVSHGDLIKAVLADALGMHLDSFQRIVVDPASISIIRYTAARPYLITANSTTVDLASFLAPPPKRARSRPPKSPNDAPVGGGLGAADVSK